MSYYRPSSFSFLPTVVKNLLIINVLFFIGSLAIEYTLGIDAHDALGMHLPGSEKFRLHQVISYMFMHGNFQHLFFNMLAVWMFGSALENSWGPKRFLSFYMITGIGAALIHYTVLYFEQIGPVIEIVNSYLENPDLNNFHSVVASIDINPVVLEDVNALKEMGNTSEALSRSTQYLNMYKEEFLNAPNVVGASGSVFGLLLGYGMLFPNQYIYLYFAIPIKAKYFVMLYGAIELFAGVSGSQSGIAHFAHLGGMLFGYMLIKIWGKHKFNQY